MPKVTTAQLLEMIEELQAKIAALEEDRNPPVQYVRELKPREPLPGRIDFAEMSSELSYQYSMYDEAKDVWGAEKYL